ncbi:MAG: HEAT repeat domain-containing protein, partial [Nitrospiraceae bacterium]
GRHRQLDEAKDARAQVLLKVLDRQLEAATKKLLVEDFKSGDAVRQQHAAQLLGSLGRVSLPLLVDIIKQEEELRVRQIAASLLADLGPKAVAVLKRELVLEIAPQERVRILEVVDSVTRALKTELAYALGEKNPEVRQAAFRLAERLNDKQTTDLILAYAADGDSELATSAIRCLGKLKPVGIVDVLVSLMNSGRDEDHVLACCQAMGQVADSACIESLGKILSTRKGWFSRKKWTPQVRAAAAFALGQIAHLRAAEVLALFTDDPDPRVRQIAQASLNK